MIQNIKQKIKLNNGFTGQDILIAIFIITLFLSVFTTLMINLSITSAEIEDVKRITEKVTNIADKIDAMPYNDIEVSIEEKDITELLGSSSEISDEKDNLKVTYTVKENEITKNKEIELFVKKITRRTKTEVDGEETKKDETKDVFKMKLSKQVVTIEEDSGDGPGDGSGDGEGSDTETKPIESLEHTEIIENSNREDISKNTINYINGLTKTDGTTGDAKNGSTAIIWTNTPNTVVNIARNRFSFWCGYKIKKSDNKYTIIEKTSRAALTENGSQDIELCSKGNITLDKDTLLLLFYQSDFPANIDVGDNIEFDFDYTQHNKFGSEKGCGNTTIYREKTSTTTQTKTLYKTSEHTVNTINKFDNEGRTTIYYSKTNQYLKDINPTYSMAAWDGYILKKQNDYYFVTTICGSDKREYQLKPDEFMLLFYESYRNKPKLKLGDCVKLNFDHTAITSGINSDGYGQVSIFNTETKPEIEEPKPEGPRDEIVINTNAQYSHNRPIKTSEVNQKGYEFGSGKYLTPIKFVWTEVTSTNRTGYWVRTTEDDIEWYSLEENIWPTFSYSTATFKNYGSVSGYTKHNLLHPLKSNPFTGLRFGKTNIDDKYIFIWLPRMVRDLNTESQNNNAQYYWAYENTNKRIGKSSNGYSHVGGSINIYNYNLYSNNLNTVYSRGTIIGWYKDKNENGGWDEIFNLASSTTHRYNVPAILEKQIRNINKHSNDQPLQ